MSLSLGCAIPEIKSRASRVLGRHGTTEPHPQPQIANTLSPTRTREATES